MKINRRSLLSTIVTLPAIAALPISLITPAYATTSTSDVFTNRLRRSENIINEEIFLDKTVRIDFPTTSVIDGCTIKAVGNQWDNNSPMFYYTGNPESKTIMLNCDIYGHPPFMVRKTMNDHKYLMPDHYPEYHGKV